MGRYENNNASDTPMNKYAKHFLVKKVKFGLGPGY
jgi:predicted component of viral defense system (DUF524 family)